MEGSSFEIQSPSTKERIIVKKFTGDRQKWGVKVNLEDQLSEWRVLDLQPKGIFAKRGVQIGWKFLKINNFQFKEENRGLIEIMLKETQKCRITFLDDSGLSRRVSDIDEAPAPPAPVGEVLHTHHSEEELDHDGFIPAQEEYTDDGPVISDDFAHERVSDRYLSDQSEVIEEDYDNVPEASDGEDISAEEQDLLKSPSAPSDNDHEPYGKPPLKPITGKWRPKGAPLPDRAETPDVNNPELIQMHSNSDEI